MAILLILSHTSVALAINPNNPVWNQPEPQWQPQPQAQSEWGPPQQQWKPQPERQPEPEPICPKRLLDVFQNKYYLTIFLFFKFCQQT